MLELGIVVSLESQCILIMKTRKTELDICEAICVRVLQE